MSFFKKLFAKTESESPQTPQPEAGREGPNFPLCHSLEELLVPFGPIGHEKQLRFAEAIGPLPFQFDMQKGKITFGEQYKFPVQILGTFSKSQETFMWAWANVHSGIPAQLLKQSKAMKGYGDDHGILELFEDSFKADMKFLHTIGMIATGMFDSSCYFLADYGQGLMLLTMQAPIVDQLDRDHALVLLKVFPEAISNFVFAHEPALEHYVKLKGYSVENDGKHLKASKGNFILEATFDDLGRMTKLTGGEKPEGV